MTKDDYQELQKKFADKPALPTLNEVVTVTPQGQDNFYVVHCTGQNRQNHIVKIDQDHYINKKTNEVCEFQHTNNRAESVDSLKQTFRKLRLLIANNFFGNNNELFITLTYRPDENGEPMTDLSCLEHDFTVFTKRLKRYVKKSFGENKNVEYIAVREPQESGAWHLHLLLKVPQLRKLYIANNEIERMWEQGWTKTEKMARKDAEGYPIKHLGAYLCSYFTDILDPGGFYETEEGREEVLCKSKRYIFAKQVAKKARLCLYPLGMNVFTKTRGIIYPEKKTMKLKDFFTDYAIHPAKCDSFKQQYVAGGEIGVTCMNFNRKVPCGHKFLEFRALMNGILNDPELKESYEQALFFDSFDDLSEEGQNALEYQIQDKKAWEKTIRGLADKKIF